MLGCLFECLNNCYVQYAAAFLLAFVAIRLYLKRRSEDKLNDLRFEWARAGKDVVVFHQFDRPRSAPSGSPFPIKLETFLRMAGVKYEADFEQQMSDKGKSPWITLNGKDVADSQLAIEFIEKGNKNIVTSFVS